MNELGNLKIIGLALLGGVLGWALGKILDRYSKIQYIILFGLILVIAGCFFYG